MLGAVLHVHRVQLTERHVGTDAHRPADDVTPAPGHTQPDTRTHGQRAAHDHHSPACDFLRGTDLRPTDRDELAADIGCRDD